MSASGIQGQLLEVTVIAGNKLKNTEWLSRQDPYVCVDYGSTKCRTRVCTDGGRNPIFQEKFVFTLIEGLRELNVVVWNSNTITYDDFIGSGKVQLQKVLSQGYDDSSWAILDKRGRHAGEVRLIMHYANANATANKPSKPTGYGNHAPSAPPYGSAPTPQASLYSAPQSSLYSAPPSLASYPPTSYPPQSPYPSYPPTSSGYPPSPYSNKPQTAYPSFYPPQQPSAYPPQQPSAYPPQQPSAYPPQQPSAYPPQQQSMYPPPPSVYPPPPYPPPPQEQQQYYPPGSYPSAPYLPRQY